MDARTESKRGLHDDPIKKAKALDAHAWLRVAGTTIVTIGRRPWGHPPRARAAYAMIPLRTEREGAADRLNGDYYSSWVRWLCTGRA